ncbi:hypothetical protein L2E82_25181 [Cichorium intybus]|uniref:Uncharacterized protein n=1 Tax=Cichorium intybus TaxID=13427 RepID=A0ACB9E2Y7_CICIN|nr:hypothetical protein L2E82_25181 [Cichorium intybus]
MLFLVRSNPLALSKSDSSIIDVNVAVSGLVTGTFLHLKLGNDLGFGDSEFIDNDIKRIRLSTNSPSEVGDLVGFYRLPPSEP